MSVRFSTGCVTPGRFGRIFAPDGKGMMKFLFPAIPGAMMGEPVLSMSRRTLHRSLTQSGGVSLEPSIRRFMERKFGADFGEVRIHTGPAAASLCRKLQARALVLGADIVFGDGEYVPASPSGRQLLAHELVHVLQQRAALPHAQSALVPVGDIHDECEREADRLAEEALGAGLRSAVTPDGAGAIRRVISIVPDSAKVTVNTTDVEPGAAIMNAGKEAILHLSKNHALLLAGSTDDKATSAVNIKGELAVRLEARDDISRWRFGFIQLAKTTVDLIGYAGVVPEDGSIAQNLVAPPIMPAKFAGEAGDYCLDSLRAFMPFTNARAPQVIRDGKGGAKIVVDMDDHPWQRIPLNVFNQTTRQPNFLYRAARHFEAIAVFVARNEALVIQPLAHVGWGAIWGAGFRWMTPTHCVPSMKAKAFFVSDVVKGAPAGLETLITNPTADEHETCNFLSAQANHFSINPRNPPAVYSESRSWAKDVPTEFSPIH